MIRVGLLSLFALSASGQSLLLLGVGGSGIAKQWSVIQTKFHDTSGNGAGGTCASSSTTCNTTVSTIGAGHVLVATAVFTGPATDSTLSSISGETSTSCGACHGSDTTGTVYLDTRYVLSATGGETSITCTVSQTATYNSCWIIELQWTGSTVTFDTGGIVFTTGTSATGPTLTLGGTTDAIISIFNPYGANTDALSGTGWVNQSDGSTNGSGISVASHINTNSGAAPSWTQGTNVEYMISSIALSGT